MSQKLRLVRVISIALLSVVFSYLAYYLALKQNEKYALTSFKIENETTGILINNCDRLSKKITSYQDLLVNDFPIDLQNGLDYLLANKSFSINDICGKQCYISLNGLDFSISFQADLAASDVQDILKNSLEIESAETAEGLKINGKNYWIKNYRDYTTISSKPVEVKKDKHTFNFGNTDYLVFSNHTAIASRHILANNLHHVVQEDTVIAGPLGATLWYKNYLNHIPSSFDELEFFGSARWITDYVNFFSTPDENSFDWADGGIILVKKDTFHLMIAPQSLEQDLKLLLEEQAHNALDDTSQIRFFNIGPFEIMPFKTTYNWSAALRNEYNEFKYYTSVENYNVVSNSIPAMRWYLSELQLGNLFLKNAALEQLSLNAIPNRLHNLKIQQKNTDQISVQSKLWRTNKICLSTQTEISNKAFQKDNVLLLADFEVGINPTKIQSFRVQDSVFILLNNETQVALYSFQGKEKWRLNLSSNLVSTPQLIDVDNNGQSEIVLFQGTQFDVLKLNGSSLSGFPKTLSNGLSKGGLAVNYDNSFNYRFLVNTGTQVMSFDEAGKAVEGWSFAGMTAPLKGSITYFITQDKDLIAFKDANNNQYVLNRRGESRINKLVQVNLPNESDFVVGKYETSSLRKLGYKNNVIQNYYLMDGHIDSLKLDESVYAINARWIFNNNQPLLLVEEKERVVVFDEFGYVKSTVLKPEGQPDFIDVSVKQGFSYVFADNSQNSLYLLNEYGKMILPVALKASKVVLIKDGLLFTFAGTKIKIYQLE